MKHSTELFTATDMKTKAEQATNSADQLLAKYLNGRHAAALSTSEDGKVSWNKFSEQVENHGTSFLSRFSNRGKKETKTNLFTKTTMSFENKTANGSHIFSFISLLLFAMLF